MRRWIVTETLSAILLCVTCFAQQAATDLKSLVGKKAIAQRMPFFEPGTYKTIPNTYAGQEVTIIAFKPMAMPAILSPEQLARLGAQQRAMIQDAQNRGTIVVQFADGTKADTGTILPSLLGNYLELVETPVPSMPAVPVPLNGVGQGDPEVARDRQTNNQESVIVPRAKLADPPPRSVIPVVGKDKSNTYQMGTYLTTSIVSDGTITDSFFCGDSNPLNGHTVCGGGIESNSVAVYRVQVANGVWRLETARQAQDAAVRRMLYDEPLHFKREKSNPLDLLKNRDAVLFRVVHHKALFGGGWDEIYIPFADNPNKEARFEAWFDPTVSPLKPQPASDNVKAMCNAHKLSPELDRQYCTASTK
jgi:hypothetical protein